MCRPLCQIFSFGRLSDYLSFHKSHADLLAKNGISHDKAVSDMRLLSLGLLASDFEEIPYAEISRTLQVPEVSDYGKSLDDASLI